MKIDDMFPSNYFRAGDFTTPALLRIRAVELRNVGESDSPEDKPVVYFDDQRKGLVLNRTNANTLAHLYGPESDGWVGVQVVLFEEPTTYMGKPTTGIRVRAPRPGSAAAQQQPPAAQQAAAQQPPADEIPF